jgi:hypothetical protein
MAQRTRRRNCLCTRIRRPASGFWSGHTVEKALAQFLERATQVNQDPY